MSDLLIQTRVPEEIGRWAMQKAANEGLSMAAWLRRLLISEANRRRTEDGVVPKDEANPGRYLVAPPAPDHLLERTRDISTNEVAFWMLHGSPTEKRAKPVSAEWLGDVNWNRRPDEYRFLIKGSPRPWVIARIMNDTTAGRMELVLRME